MILFAVSLQHVSVVSVTLFVRLSPTGVTPLVLFVATFGIFPYWNLKFYGKFHHLPKLNFQNNPWYIFTSLWKGTCVQWERYARACVYVSVDRLWRIHRKCNSKLINRFRKSIANILACYILSCTFHNKQLRDRMGHERH